MTTENLQTAVQRLSKRREYDKYSLWYIIRTVDYKSYQWSYLEWYYRDQWLEKLVESIKKPECWERLIKLNGFKDLV